MADGYGKIDINAMLGDGTACRPLFGDVAVHWYPSGAAPGDTCWCGQSVMKADDFDEGDSDG